MILKLQSIFWPYLPQLVATLIPKLTSKVQMIKDEINDLFQSMFKYYEGSAIIKYTLSNVKLSSISCKIEAFKIIEPALDGLGSINPNDILEIVFVYYYYFYL